jgi:hypothetical protein
MSWSTYDEEFLVEFDDPAAAVDVLRSTRVSKDHWPSTVQFAWSEAGPLLAVSVGDEVVVTYEVSLDPVLRQLGRPQTLAPVWPLTGPRGGRHRPPAR